MFLPCSIKNAVAHMVVGSLGYPIINKGAGKEVQCTQSGASYVYVYIYIHIHDRYFQSRHKSLNTSFLFSTLWTRIPLQGDHKNLEEPNLRKFASAKSQVLLQKVAEENRKDLLRRGIESQRFRISKSQRFWDAKLSISVCVTCEVKRAVGCLTRFRTRACVIPMMMFAILSLRMHQPLFAEPREAYRLE